MTQPVLFHSRKELPYGVFSNFQSSPIIIAEKWYPTVEHWYQANKTSDESLNERIRTADSPEEAKSIGRALTTRHDWNDVRLTVMYRGMLAKFQQHRDLREALLETGDRPIHEASDDQFWGRSDGAGEDWAGALLMAIRYQLRAGNGKLPEGKVREALAGSFVSGFQVAAGIRESRDPNGAWFTHIIRDDASMSPHRILREIVLSGELRPTSGPGHEAAVCFSAVGLSGIFERCFGTERVLRIQQKAYTRSGYGVAIPYWLGREMGLRPVLPMSRADAGVLPPEQLFRVQLYSPVDMYDWTHEDEWRSASALRLPVGHTIVLLPDAAALSDMRSEIADRWTVATLEDLARGSICFPNTIS